MIYKIVKNSLGDVIAYGPNVDEYAPTIPDGGSLIIADEMPSKSLFDTKTARIEYIKNEAEKAMAMLVASYPKHEVDTWSEQIIEAEAYTANPLAITTILSGIALGAGVTVAVIAATVLQKREALKVLTGPIIGRRKLKTAQIEACSTNAEVEAIVW